MHLLALLVDGRVREQRTLRGSDGDQESTERALHHKIPIPPVFYMSVMWMVNDDQCKHFSECTTMGDFGGGGAII